MAFFSKVRGTIESIFQVAIGGAQVKYNAGPPVALEHRNSADTGFVIARAADPSTGIGTVADNDLVTKHWEDKRFHRHFLLMGG